MLNYIWVSSANNNFSAVKSSPSQRFIPCSNVLLVFIIHDLPLAIHSQRHLILKRQFQHKGGILSAGLGFSKRKRVTDHSILVPEAIGFSEELLQP